MRIHSLLLLLAGGASLLLAGAAYAQGGNATRTGSVAGHVEPGRRRRKLP